MHRVHCPSCGHKLKYGDEYAGKKAKCPKCGSSFCLPNPDGNRQKPDAAVCGNPTRGSGRASRPAAVPRPGVQAAESQQQVSVGDKHLCPKCGGTDVRAMTAAEMQEFYGGNAFVLSPPRCCQACGHGWEARPTRFGCYVMIAFSALLAVCSAGAVLGAAIYCVLTLFAGNVVTPLIGGVTVVLPAAGILYASVTGVKKYRGYLKQAS